MKAILRNFNPDLSPIGPFQNEELNTFQSITKRTGTGGPAILASSREDDCCEPQEAVWLVLFPDGKVGGFIESELEFIDDEEDHSKLINSIKD